MNNINVVVVKGNLTKDSEKRSTTTGMTALRFTIANNYSRKVNDQWQNEVNYLDAVLWGKRAEALFPYLKKGTPVILKGQLRQTRWEKDGNKYSKIEIFADECELCGKMEEKKPEQKSFDNFEDYGPEEFEKTQSDIPF